MLTWLSAVIISIKILHRQTLIIFHVVKAVVLWGEKRVSRPDLRCHGFITEQPFLATELWAVLIVLSIAASQANYTVIHVVWCPNQNEGSSGSEWAMWMCLCVHVCLHVYVKHITTSTTGHLAICWVSAQASVSLSTEHVHSLLHFICWLREGELTSEEGKKRC